MNEAPVAPDAVARRPWAGQSARRPVRFPLLLKVYLGLVAATGLVLVASITLDSASDGVHRAGTAAWVFTALLLVGELRPVRGIRHHGSEEMTTSPTFAFALLLSVGPAFAVLAHAVASLVADGFHRRPLERMTFNVAQDAIALTAAAVVLARLDATGGLIDGRVDADTLVAVLLAGSAFSLASNAVSALASVVERGRWSLRSLRVHLPVRLATDMILVALAPVVVVIGYRSIALLPLLLLPVVAVYQSARASMQKEYQALHDPLTALPNRTLFYERAEHAIAAARQSRQALAVMLLDLDRFKDVNDTLGHHTGDLLLTEIAGRLQEVLGDRATVARLGGDEFAVLLPDAADRSAASERGQAILRAVERPVYVEEMALSVEGSIGVAMYPEHGTDVETLMKRADVAMYDAKRNHRGCTIYRAERDGNSRRRLSLLGQLRGALKHEELVLHYQPQAHLPTGEVRAFEALVRWHHPEHGLVLPDEFIPLAEYSGLIEPLTRRVLDVALHQVHEWTQQGLDLRVSVNLSVRNLYDPNFPSDLTRLLRGWGLDGRSLQVEVTETTVMADAPRAIRVLSELNELGVRVAIDDFGTGYSSLAYLRQLPVDEIKIDKSFVTAMATDRNDALIVRSIIDLARSMQLSTVAEGVESDDAWGLLTELGCDLAQGFLLSKPMVAADCIGWLARRPALLTPPALAIPAPARLVTPRLVSRTG